MIGLDYVWFDGFWHDMIFAPSPGYDAVNSMCAAEVFRNPSVPYARTHVDEQIVPVQDAWMPYQVYFNGSDLISKLSADTYWWCEIDPDKSDDFEIMEHKVAPISESGQFCMTVMVRARPGSRSVLHTGSRLVRLRHIQQDDMEALQGLALALGEAEEEVPDSVDAGKEQILRCPLPETVSSNTLTCSPDKELSLIHISEPTRPY